MRNYIIVILFSTLLLVGCLEEFDDGYQLGDLTRTVVTYCDEAEDDLLRELALERLNEKHPGVSKEGICEHVK